MRTSNKSGATAAARAAVQLMFSTGRAYVVESLRETLRDNFKSEANPDLRAIAAVTTHELVRGLLETNTALAAVGITVRITNGEVSLWAGPVQGETFRAYLDELTGGTGVPGLTQDMLEILGCIHLKQPISQAEIDRYFDSDRRHLVNRLVSLDLVSGIAGGDGRRRYITTETFRQRFPDDH